MVTWSSVDGITWTFDGPGTVGTVPVGIVPGGVFTVPYVPVAGGIALYRGAFCRLCPPFDYILIGHTITLTLPLAYGETLIADIGDADMVYGIVPAGAIDGVNRIFTSPVDFVGLPAVTLSTTRLNLGEHYNVTGPNEITYASIVPAVGDWMLFDFQTV
jgi:hypothetical protein